MLGRVSDLSRARDRRGLYSQPLRVPGYIPGDSLEPQPVAVHGGAAAGAQRGTGAGAAAEQGAEQQERRRPLTDSGVLSPGHDPHVWRPLRSGAFLLPSCLSLERLPSQNLSQRPPTRLSLSPSLVLLLLFPAEVPVPAD